MRSFDELLVEAVALHGHLCPGQVLGVRMAVAGCQAVGVENPTQSKELLVYVEIDRCATDAIQTVTGCKLGKRTLKYLDYGKLAATFLNTQTRRAVRVLARDDSRDKAPTYAPEVRGKEETQIAAYRVMPDDELFVLTPVFLGVPQEDRPGHPVGRVLCSACGEGVNDRREVWRDGRVLCRACAHGAYYTPLAVREIAEAIPPELERFGQL
ncbi:MAG: TraR/DksA C4-type zinc finger protein [Chloroflexi bacterium]|nr:TraR/DksA C4-type zinc finger protein [Chloroflexota bacterium]